MALVVRIEFRSGQRARSFAPLMDSYDELNIDPLSYPNLVISVEPLTKQAAHWAEVIAKRTTGDVVLLAYCSATALALAIARRLTGRHVTVALFEPIRVLPHDIQAEIESGAATLEVPPDAAPFVADKERMLEAADAYLSSLAAGVDTGLPPEIDKNIKRQLIERLLGWISYLIAAAEGYSDDVQPGLKLHVFGDPEVIQQTMAVPAAARLHELPAAAHPDTIVADAAKRWLAALLDPDLTPAKG